MIKVIRRPRLKKPIFIGVWPGMGEVAFRTGLFLKEALEFKPFAKLEARGFFPITGIVVKDGILDMPSVPVGIFYYYRRAQKENDIILFIGEAQPPLQFGEKLVEMLINFLKKFGVEYILSFAAKPESIDHKTTPKLWVASTEKEILETYKKEGLNILKDGQVTGLNGLILGIAKKEGLKGTIILSEIPLYTVQIENPKATVAILRVLDKIYKFNLNLEPLLERDVFIEEEIDQMINYLKGESPVPDKPLGEEDIEKIKKDLALYTKLPHSAREKIEFLFKEAQKDISKARQLKEFLDHWNVYKEYEDRFLELFKKGQEDSH